MTLTCAGCQKNIIDREFLTCTSCKESYELDCANVSSQRFYNTMTAEHKKTWVCQLCRRKTPKTGNINKPIGHNQNEKTQPIKEQIQQSNITTRKKPAVTRNISTESNDLSILGDTIDEDNSGDNRPTITETINNFEEGPITLNSINKLLEINLQRNNKSIISEIKRIVQNEIEEAMSKIRNETKQKIEEVHHEQVKLHEEIQGLTHKIQQLQEQYQTLQNETQKLQREFDQKLKEASLININGDNSKTFVLYGLMENYWETEEQSYERVIQTMYDITNIDLTGYIEELSRIGKKGSKRPIKIELISKRMKDYILKNGQYFKDTGLAVSLYLDNEALQERNLLRNALISARKKGQHAVIRNKKLLIDGKEISLQTLQNLKSIVENRNSAKNIQEIIQKDTPIQTLTLNKKNKEDRDNFRNFHNFQNSVPKYEEYTKQNPSTGSTFRGRSEF